MAEMSYDELDGQIWFNGEMLPWTEAKVHVLTHGLHYGSCVFEGERAYNGRIFKMVEHHERLLKSAEILGFEIPYSRAEIDAAAVPLLPGVAELAAAGEIPGGTRRNLAAIAGLTDFGGVDNVTRLLLADAQTSGGLLVAAPPPVVAEIARHPAASGTTIVGSLVHGEAGRIAVTR